MSLEDMRLLLVGALLAEPPSLDDSGRRFAMCRSGGHRRDARARIGDRGAPRPRKSHGTAGSKRVMVQPGEQGGSQLLSYFDREIVDGARGLPGPEPGVAPPLLGALRDVPPRPRRRRRRDDVAGLPRHDQPHRRGRRARPDGDGGHPLHGQGLRRPPESRPSASPSRCGATSRGAACPATSSCSSSARRSPACSCAP